MISGVLTGRTSVCALGTHRVLREWDPYGCSLGRALADALLRVLDHVQSVATLRAHFGVERVASKAVGVAQLTSMRLLHWQPGSRKR